METRDVDFDIDMTADQWAEVGDRAAALGIDGGGYARHGFDAIDVYLRAEDAPPLWRDYLADPETYGAAARQVSRFLFNGGRPYARIEVGEFEVEPVFLEEEQEAMRRELEVWVRWKWHSLLRDSGLHYERGHIPQA